MSLKICLKEMELVSSARSLVALIDMLLLTDRKLLTFLKSFLLFFFSNLTLVRHGRGMFLKFFQNVKVQSDALETPLIV